MKIASQVAAKIQSTIADSEFISKHRYNPQAFTRNRKLPFGTIVSTILQLAKRSLQIAITFFIPSDCTIRSSWTHSKLLIGKIYSFLLNSKIYKLLRP